MFNRPTCSRVLHLSKTLQRQEYHATGRRISGDEVVRLSIARDHPELHALGHLELLLLGEEGPERLSPHGRAFGEELANKQALLLSVRPMGWSPTQIDTERASV